MAWPRPPSFPEERLDLHVDLRERRAAAAPHVKGFPIPHGLSICGGPSLPQAIRVLRGFPSLADVAAGGDIVLC